MKFVIFTDTHMVPEGAPLYGIDPGANLAAAVELVEREHADAAFVLHLGDLTNRGEPGAYARAAAILAGLSRPLLLLTGNHDDRAEMRRHFPGLDDDGAGFVQALRVMEEATILTLDTLEPEAGTAGRLCPRRLAFLDRALSEAPTDRPLLLFQHHPPLDLGLPGMDRIRLLDADDEHEVFIETRFPDWIFCGHVHRPISGRWRGIPFLVPRGTSHQIAYDPRPGARNAGSREAPEITVVDVRRDGTLIAQARPIFDPGRFALGDLTGATPPEG